MARFKFSLFILLALIAAACGGGGETARQEFDVSNFLVNAGATEQGIVEIGGRSVEYMVTIPEGFSVGDTAPVLLALPPGGQDLEITRNAHNAVYHGQALSLGWVVVSPAAPGGDLFFNGGGEVLPGFVDWIEAWVTPEGGAPHLAGISNGGISAFRFAGENPDRIQSLIAFPGFPESDDDKQALAELSGIPIRMHVGGTDAGWISRMQEAENLIVSAGGNVRLATYAGEGHVIQSTSDGEIVFGQLESFRAS